jgi:hypothetical protein
MRLIIIIIVVFFTISCEEPKFKVGQQYGGGIIFYVDKSGEHGLIAAPFDQGKAPWGCPTTKVNGADGIGIGTGLQNTIDIVTSCAEDNIAAKLCYDLILNGYDDWFLPSKDELNQLFLQKEKVGRFAIDQTAPYWSSTEYEISNGAWRQTFADYFEQTIYGKSDVFNVRAIRKF